MTNKSAYLDDSISSEDVDRVAANMRESDRVEIWNSNHATPDSALMLSIPLSTMLWAVRSRKSGLAIGILGACPHPGAPGHGVPWLLATPEFDSVGVRILRESRDVVRKMLGEFSFLENWVGADNFRTVKWLEWCGYEIDEPLPFGAEGKLFRRFHKERG